MQSVGVNMVQPTKPVNLNLIWFGPKKNEVQNRTGLKCKNELVMLWADLWKRIASVFRLHPLRTKAEGKRIK